MNRVRACILALSLVVPAAGAAVSSTERGFRTDYAPVDVLYSQIQQTGDGISPVLSIDHARLAAQEGVLTMAPSRVAIFSNPAVNTALMQANPLVGLELPYRVLAYADGGSSRAIYADGSYLRQRYALDDAVSTQAYDDELTASVAQIDGRQQLRLAGDRIEAGAGIISLESQYDFGTTLARIERAIRAQADTVWFGQVDFAQDAQALEQTILPATLQLFGGPAPGGVAMTDYPQLGLNAFCQKVLVLQDESGRVSVHLNDIEALARLQYGSSSKPHEIINNRLVATLSGAISL
ncbi:MAG: DUF302 domain-containing protein [Halioglobus sp.]